MQVNVVSTEDNLKELVELINAAKWDDDNAISPYEVDALTAYLNRQDTVFVACFEEVLGKKTLLGMASSRIEMKPYNHELWFYVDEVDVCADQRQRGVGSSIMKKLLHLAEAAGCEELWLGTEVDNKAANALYKALDPDDVDQVVGYTWETDSPP